MHVRSRGPNGWLRLIPPACSGRHNEAGPFTRPLRQEWPCCPSAALRHRHLTLRLSGRLPGRQGPMFWCAPPCARCKARLPHCERLPSGQTRWIGTPPCASRQCLTTPGGTLQIALHSGAPGAHQGLVSTEGSRGSEASFFSLNPGASMSTAACHCGCAGTTLRCSALVATSAHIPQAVPAPLYGHLASVSSGGETSPLSSTGARALHQHPGPPGSERARQVGRGPRGARLARRLGRGPRDILL